MSASRPSTETSASVRLATLATPQDEGLAGVAQQAPCVPVAILTTRLVNSVCKPIMAVCAPRCKRPIHMAVQRPFLTTHPRLHPSAQVNELTAHLTSTAITSTAEGKKESTHANTHERAHESTRGSPAKRQRISASLKEAGAERGPLPELQPILMVMCRELLRPPTRRMVEG